MRPDLIEDSSHEANLQFKGVFKLSVGSLFIKLIQLIGKYDQLYKSSGVFVISK